LSSMWTTTAWRTRWTRADVIHVDDNAPPRRTTPRSSSRA
jgi:hypothetical protein